MEIAAKPPCNPKRQRGQTLQETLNSSLCGAPALANASGYFFEHCLTER